MSIPSFSIRSVIGSVAVSTSALNKKNVVIYWPVKCTWKMKLERRVNKELERTEFALAELEVEESDKAKDLEELVRSYFNDAKYFIDEGEHLKALSLLSYTWGLLDAGARLGVLDPGEAREHYKIDQRDKK